MLGAAPRDADPGKPSTNATGRATPSSSPGSRADNRPLDDDLRRLIDAWPTLPDAVRAGIVAMVKVTEARR